MHDFYGSKYASCLAQLEKLQPALKLDVHLNKYATDLSTAVSQALSLACQWTAKLVQAICFMPLLYTEAPNATYIQYVGTALGVPQWK